MSKIKTGEFVKRQTKESPFSYFSGSWEQLEKMVEANREKAVQGFREGVFLTPVPAEGFFTSYVKLTPETKLISEFKPRREGEAPFVHVYAVGEKAPAKKVVIVTYSAEALGPERSTDADYEIVSINASPFEDRDVPMDPITMTRNFLSLVGGTKGEFTPQQFAESVLFHSQYAQVKGS